jgi:hypothetical protein
MGVDRTTFRITRIGPDTKPGLHPIDLVSVQQVTSELCGFAETDREHPARQGIQAAGMPRLARLEQPLDPLERRVGRYSGRLVQQK